MYPILPHPLSSRALVLISFLNYLVNRWELIKSTCKCIASINFITSIKLWQWGHWGRGRELGGEVRFGHNSCRAEPVFTTWNTEQQPITHRTAMRPYAISTASSLYSHLCQSHWSRKVSLLCADKSHCARTAQDWQVLDLTGDMAQKKELILSLVTWKLI